jgi:sporulation protein YlmC with PRC-barrel domain
MTKTNPLAHPINAAMAAITLVTALSWGLVGTATAQVAGATTTLGITVTESTQLALGWSVKKTLLGKVVYNETGTKVGKVEDLIITPDKNLSYVIVGAGGFVGIGRHDVAIPVAQIRDQAGRLVMAGATQASVKALPQFEYADDGTRRQRFVAMTEKKLAEARLSLVDLEHRSAAASADAKVKLGEQVTTVQGELKSAEGQLTRLKQAAVARWHEFEGDVSTATDKLRKSLDDAKG